MYELKTQLDFGGPWLALELIRKLKLDELLESVMPLGKEDIPWSRMAIVLAISRLCNPSSELHIAEHYYAKTAMPELLGIPGDKVYDERLYRALDKLLPHKETLEKHLKNRLGTLFDLKIRPAAVRCNEHLLREANVNRTRWPNAVIRGINVPTANRSASGWSFPSAACRWGTKYSTATATT